MFENPTVNLHALCSSCANIGCCSSELIFTFLNADSSIQNASKQCVSCIHLSSVNFALRPAPQNRNLTELGPGDSNNSVSVPIQSLTHVHIHFFPHNDRHCPHPKYWHIQPNHPILRCGRGLLQYIQLNTLYPGIRRLRWHCWGTLTRQGFRVL
jgi:hypothetical protein